MEDGNEKVTLEEFSDLSVKETAQKAIARMPDDVEDSRLVYEVYLFLNLRQAQLNLRDGQFLDHEEVERRMKKWFLGVDDESC